MGAQVVTLGCRLNAYESEIMRAHLEAGGLDDAVVVNTCAVTAEAQRQARQAIRKAKRARPDARIIVTGCAAQIEPERFAAMPEVDLVLGNEEKLQPEHFRAADFGLAAEERVRVNDIMSVRETALHMIEGFEARARAFVQIQNGCDHRCTFCVIPYGRGNSRSVPAGDVVAQTRRLVENGYQEVVLTGVDITAYGRDLPGRPPLGRLVRTVLRQVPDLPRLRLSSIDSIEADEALVRAFAEEERLMPHLHLSLQSGDNLVLKRMKRRHSREDSIIFCTRMRELRPDMVFGADLISGFPTETEAMFQNTLALVDDCGLSLLHVFPYSARPGTPAARMPQVPGGTVKARAARLRGAGALRFDELLSRFQGHRLPVLMETETLGRTEHFVAAELDRPRAPGAIVEVDVTGASDDRLRVRAAA